MNWFTVCLQLLYNKFTAFSQIYFDLFLNFLQNRASAVNIWEEAGEERITKKPPARRIAGGFLGSYFATECAAKPVFPERYSRYSPEYFEACQQRG